MSPTNYFNSPDDKPWTLADIYDDLGTREDIARALNVSKIRVTDWINRRDKVNSPQPLRRIGYRDIYSIQQWKDWFRHWQKKHDGDKRTLNYVPHGSGESFWTFFEKLEQQRKRDAGILDEEPDGTPD